MQIETFKGTYIEPFSLLREIQKSKGSEKQFVEDLQSVLENITSPKSPTRYMEMIVNKKKKVNYKTIKYIHKIEGGIKIVFTNRRALYLKEKDKAIIKRIDDGVEKQYG